jgi:hypothetical protein
MTLIQYNIFIFKRFTNLAQIKFDKKNFNILQIKYRFCLKQKNISVKCCFLQFIIFKRSKTVDKQKKFFFFATVLMPIIISLLFASEAENSFF